MRKEESLEERLKSAEKKAKEISDEELREEVMKEIEDIKREIYIKRKEKITIESPMSNIYINTKVLFFEDEFEEGYVINLILPNKREKDCIHKFGFVVGMPDDYNLTFREALDYICEEYSSGNKPIQALKRKLKQGKDMDLIVNTSEKDEKSGETLVYTYDDVKLEDNIEEYISEEGVGTYDYNYYGFSLEVQWKT